MSYLIFVIVETYMLQCDEIYLDESSLSSKCDHCTCSSPNIYNSSTYNCTSPNDNTTTCTSLYQCIDGSANALCSTNCTCASGYGWIATSSRCLAYNDGTHAAGSIADCYDQTGFSKYSAGLCSCLYLWDNSLLKRGLIGIYHQVTPKHLQKYCEEFGFRYNSRKITDKERFDMVLKRTEGVKLQYNALITK